MKIIKNILLLVISFSVSFACVGQHASLKKATASADTPFAQKHIFIVHDRASKFYTWIADFGMDKYSAENYEYALLEQKRRIVALSKNTIDKDFHKTGYPYLAIRASITPICTNDVVMAAYRSMILRL